MSAVVVAAVSHGFGRDLGRCWEQIGALLDQARARGVELVVLPEASLGGYLSRLEGAEASLPPALDPSGPEIERLAELAGDLVVCAGYCEADGEQRYNSAVCVHDGSVLGRHRKVHQPLGEFSSYEAGDSFEAFDTPVGRMGMLICYDKAFPEAGRALAGDGAEIIACLSAWPASRTQPAPDLSRDRWTARFDLLDQARALENQVVWVSANQSGQFGTLRFVGRAKVVGPGGEVLAETDTGSGMAVARVDPVEDLAIARRSMFHLRDRRPHAYTVLSGNNA